MVRALPLLRRECKQPPSRECALLSLGDAIAYLRLQDVPNTLCVV